VVFLKQKNIMERVIVIILGLLMISSNYNNPQNISVSTESEQTIENDVKAYNISNSLNFENNHPYAKFCNDYQEVAIYYQIECGIPTSVQLAQAIAESGGGRSDIAKKSNNLFGMKYYKELYSGEYYTSTSGTKWRKYKNFEDSFEDHAFFLHKFYLHAVGKDWTYWVKNCKGYGANNYWEHIGMVIEKYKLWRYDNFVNDYQTKRTYDL